MTRALARYNFISNYELTILFVFIGIYRGWGEPPRQCLILERLVVVRDAQSKMNDKLHIWHGFDNIPTPRIIVVELLYGVEDSAGFDE